MSGRPVFTFPSRLYAIADDRACALPLAAQVAALLAGGARLLQVRSKALSDDALLPLLREAAARCRAAGAMLLINDRAHLVIPANAHGVHLGQQDRPVAQARALLGRDRLIGLSTHDETEFAAGLESDADYLALGPIFPTATKAVPFPCHGIEGLRNFSSRCDRPLVAIGGITRESMPEVLAAGVAAAAVIGAVWNAPAPALAVGALRSAAGESTGD